MQKEKKPLNKKVIVLLAAALIIGLLISFASYLIYAPSYGSNPDFSYFSNGYLAVNANGKFGFVDRSGELGIPAQFDYAEDFTENGLALVGIADENGTVLYGYINKNGDYAVLPIFTAASSFSENFALVSHNGTQMYINKTGQNAFNDFTFDEGTSFKNGCACFKRDSLWGHINSYGKTLTLPMYSKPYQFDKNGVAVIEYENKSGMINKLGDVLVIPQYAFIGNMSEDTAPFCTFDGKWGYLNKSGKIVIEAQFDSADPFYGDVAVAGKKNESGEMRFGYITRQGVYQVSPIFRSAQRFSANSQAVIIDENGEYRYIDKTGVPSAMSFDFAKSFGYLRFATVLKNGKWGYYNEFGSYSINPKFSDAKDFSSDGLALAKTNSGWGFIDRRGDFVILPQFELAYEFDKNDTALVKANGKWGFINRSGRYVSDFRFDNFDISFLSEE